MEPNDLNPHIPPDDAQLDAWLRASASLTPLPDDGFSRQVLAVLPAPAYPRSSRRLLVMIAGAAAGLGVAAAPMFPIGNPLALLPTLDAALLVAFQMLANPALGLAIAATVASLLFVFWRDLRRFLPS